MDKIAVLGTGNSGLALAADLTLRGFPVNLGNLPQFASRVEALRKSGGIRLQEHGQKTLVKIHRIGTDLPKLIGGVSHIFIAVPAYRHELFIRAIAPLLEDHQYLVFISYFGALRFGHWQEKYRIRADVIPVEAQSLPYTARRTAADTIHIIERKKRLFASALPARKNAEFCRSIAGIFPEITAADTVLFSSLNNFNAVINPPLMLANAERIASGVAPDWNLYAHGISEPVAQKILDVDRERIQLAGRFQTRAIPFAQALLQLPAGAECNAEQFCHAIKNHLKLTDPRVPCPRSPDHRYLTENIPFALVPFLTLAELAEIATPALRSVVDSASQILQRDFYAEGAKARELDIAGFSIPQLISNIA